MKKFERQYGEKRSERFWNAVNDLPEAEQSEMYSLGCVLQNVEGFVLHRLNTILKEIEDAPHHADASKDKKGVA